MKVWKITYSDKKLHIRGDNGDIIDPEIYHRLAKSHNQKANNIWQTFVWTELLIKTGYISTGFILHDERYSFFVQKRSLGGGQFGLFVLGLHVNYPFLYESLQDLCKKEQSLFVQIEPLNIDIIFGRKGYYKRFIEQYTGIINTTQTPEDILKNMKPKGRYNIRLSDKRGIHIMKVPGTPENIEHFYSLLQQTTDRNQFSQNNRQYYQELVSLLESHEWGGLYLAKKDDAVIAGAIFTYCGDQALYYYGASTSDYKMRKHMAPYGLQWAGIQEALSRKCSTYDFLGMADENGNPQHLAGVTDFKSKFGPELHKWKDSWIYIPKPLKYRAFCLLRSIKKLL